MVPFVCGKSVKGASHIRARIGCQDSFKNRSLDDGTIILTVADGHGSASCPYSKTGSRIAVNVFCKTMEEFGKKYVGDFEKLFAYLRNEGRKNVAQIIHEEWKRRVLKRHMKSKREDLRLANGEKDEAGILKKYGTTLVGLMITPAFWFAFQIGDGDISYADSKGFKQVLQTEKILGTETHSLSKIDCWKQAKSRVYRQRVGDISLPFVFILSTDGFANSHKNEQEFQKTCVDYFAMLNQHGGEAVKANLNNWLEETSEKGCGDDVTLSMAYFCGETASGKRDNKV
ncbi:MAG: protein phosphatase 2C domain-containing protein [Peptococcaceae bacterium]|jgi:serine/threonine protein phosphatase PrpC|nr:protein phosphatase 2C domain-containing protein [Peptococcaceae bacterium]